MLEHGTLPAGWVKVGGRMLPPARVIVEAGERHRRNRLFRTKTRPERVFTEYLLWGLTLTTVPYKSQSLVLGFCRATVDPTLMSWRF